jgi:adenylosuccinate lyase
MIERYEQKDLSALWTEEAKAGYFLKVEIALLEALETEKIIPLGVTDQFRTSKINITRIKEIESTTHHDVIAFCTSITEQHPEKIAKWFHFGCTSSDIIDTALALQLKDSLELILKDFKTSLKLLKEKALQTKDLLTIGRSHGMYAEPMSFGQKFLLAYTEFYRRYTELNAYLQTEIVGKISGAVGNYTVLSPAIEDKVLQNLGLQTEAVSTQIVSRDHLAKLTSILGLYACALERFEIEIRHLHRSDVGELYEGFREGQKGSSTMPHKKNPIAAENLSGIARLIRSYQNVANDNTLLWHERDISHSSAERLYLPDLLGLTLYSLRRMNQQLERLQINKEIIEKRAQEAYQALSSYYLHKILPSYEGSREELYDLIQKASFQSKTLKDFHEALSTIHPKLEKNINLSKVFLKSVDEIFRRVETKYPI